MMDQQQTLRATVRTHRGLGTCSPQSGPPRRLRESRSLGIHVSSSELTRLSIVDNQPQEAAATNFIGSLTRAAQRE